MVLLQPTHPPNALPGRSNAISVNVSGRQLLSVNIPTSTVIRPSLPNQNFGVESKQSFENNRLAVGSSVVFKQNMQYSDGRLQNSALFDVHNNPSTSSILNFNVNKSNQSSETAYGIPWEGSAMYSPSVENVENLNQVKFDTPAPQLSNYHFTTERVSAMPITSTIDILSLATNSAIFEKPIYGEPATVINEDSSLNTPQHTGSADPDLSLQEPISPLISNVRKSTGVVRFPSDVSSLPVLDISLSGSFGVGIHDDNYHQNRSNDTLDKIVSNIPLESFTTFENIGQTLQMMPDSNNGKCSQSMLNNAPNTFHNAVTHEKEVPVIHIPDDIQVNASCEIHKSQKVFSQTKPVNEDERLGTGCNPNLNMAASEISNPTRNNFFTISGDTNSNSSLSALLASVASGDALQSRSQVTSTPLRRRSPSGEMTNYTLENN